MLGTTIAHYQITAKLGQGGMGEVYRATDTKLDREVAIKVLPESVAQDKERLARFEREAKTLASLDHSNIGAIYGIEEAEGKRCLILQLVEGEDLSARLKRGPLPVDEALEVCKKIAEALEAAHEKGIIHRDLKPGNVKLTEDGKVKVLDFGLAKALSDESDSSAVSSTDDSPTITDAFTKPGTILGTVAYMSPEQARGRHIDRRTDVWAFGCVLFECLTGKKAFQGEDTTEMLASILKSEPGWHAISTMGSPIAMMLRKCLAKNRKQRMQHMGDVRIELEFLLEHPETIHSGQPGSTSKDVSPPSKHRFAVALAWIMATALLAGLLTWNLKPSSPVQQLPLRKFAIPVTDLPYEFATKIKPSPDGKFIAFVTRQNIKIWRLEDLETREISLEGLTFRTPIIWSPESNMIAFLWENKLWKASVDFGDPISVCSIPGTGQILDGSWGDDRRIVFSSWRGPLYRVHEDGGVPEVILSNETHHAVDFHGVDHLPDGSIIHDTHSSDPRMSADSVSNILRWVQGESVIIYRGSPAWNPVYSTTGHILFHQPKEERIYAVPFSLKESKTMGDPFLVAQGASLPSVSDDGLLVYLRKKTTNEAQSHLVWIDQDGQVISEFGEPGVGFMSHQLSADEKTIVLMKTDEDDENGIYLYDVERQNERRLILPEDPDMVLGAPSWFASPALTPQKDFVLFAKESNLQNTLYVTKTDSSAAAVKLFEGQDLHISKDSRHMVYEVHKLDGDTDIWVCELPESGPITQYLKTAPLIASNQSEINPRLSPDSQFVLFESGTPMERKIYVARFPGMEGRWEVSRESGQFPRWSKDGTTIFYMNKERSMVAVPFESGSEVIIGAPKPLFKLDDSIEFAHYSVASDGRFLMTKKTSDSSSVEIVVVENWFEEFRDDKSAR